jgi:hypothetical protein
MEMSGAQLMFFLTVVGGISRILEARELFSDSPVSCILIGQRNTARTVEPKRLS